MRGNRAKHAFLSSEEERGKEATVRMIDLA